VTGVLARHAHEPRFGPGDEVALVNCPFHRLAEQERPLVCGMNLDFVNAIIDGIGRKGFAVLESGRLRLSGFLAWMAWAAVHLEFLSQSSLRVSVFVQWVWTYLTGQRGSRLIVNSHAPVSRAVPAASPADRQAIGTRSEDSQH